VAKRREIEERYPLRRLGEPIDVALAALYLCSDAARWVSGAVLVIDGGLSAR
jgi:NAD(P)-dependent dehydrogenase (short-subunit alcohol dehydrogenase family)